jgi:CspA family cold shock protein
VTFVVTKQQHKNKRMTGTVVRKHPNGYGFIKPDDGSKDVFFHAQSLNGVAFDELPENSKVTFDVEQGPKGPAAANVRLA